MAGDATRRPNIRDVAALAGVSYQTVSRALNRHPNIRPETLARVESAIVELGYRPNAAARALVRRSSQTIGLLTLPTTDYGPQTQAIAIETAARDAGYRIVLTNAASTSVDDLSAGLRFLRECLPGRTRHNTHLHFVAPEPLRVSTFADVGVS